MSAMAHEDQEVWKPIRAIEKGRRFEVSSLGRVRELDSRKIRKLSRTGDGYFVLRARYGQVRYNLTLHHAVAFAFLRGKPQLPVVFKNSNKSDCTLSNLRWARLADKIIRNRSLSDDQVIYIRTNAGRIPQRELALKFGVCRQTISEVVTLKTYADMRLRVSDAAKERGRQQPLFQRGAE